MKRAAYLLLLLLSCSALSAWAADCTLADYDAQYSQCRPTNRHDLIYYLKVDSTCTGGIPAPAPVFDLPCNISCPNGQYLPLGKLECEACDPGSFTSGGGELVTEWNEWPAVGLFSTFCVNNNDQTKPINCSGWTLSGTSVRSGIIDDAQTSILELHTQLLIAGTVRFTYRVNAEPVWDGLSFYVDDSLVMPKVSITSFYLEFSTPVVAGFHTFRWTYFKDSAVKAGDDAAFIRSLQISGLTYAESSCTLCEPGSFAEGSNATQCTLCPLNTYANETGSTTCTPCLDSEYAYAGATNCTLRAPCTASDYQILYGPCTAAGRTAVASWLSPHVCDDSTLDLPILGNVDCAPCSPGTFRDASFTCVPCAQGSYSAGNGEVCQSCSAGTAAVRIFNVSSFDSWPAGFSTSCTGDCGTDGWRLRSNFIDSGVGHGDEVDSQFSLDVELEQAGSLTFSFILNCTRFCSLYYLDYPFDGAIGWNTSSVGRNKLVTYTTPVALEAGHHKLTWTFEEDVFDSTVNTRADSVQIFSIVIYGTTTGGASTCTPCKTGTAASGGASLCAACDPGKSNNTDKSQCVQCEGNSFSPREGDVCYECGPTTTANSNHTDCLDTCKFTINGDPYDLTPLAGRAYGPVFGEYTYYINLCGREHLIPECIDVDEQPLNTHVCQVLPYGFAVDVGWSTGYYPLATSAPTKGFRIHYDMGTMGCGPKNNGVAFPRRSDLNFICDLTAGVGTLHGVGSIENTPCNYAFEWRSLYACPICTEADYSFYYTSCEENGKRDKIYYWKDPIQCHDGVKLPAAETVTCSDSTTFCDIGLRLSDDGKSCVPCDIGEYSVGGGLLIDTWPTTPGTLPYDYTTQCGPGACSNWASEDGVSIHSGFGNSTLTGAHSFRKSGSVSFSYKVYVVTDGIFSFLIDGVEVLSVDASNYDYESRTFSVTPGSHVFQWRFANGVRYSPSFLSYQTVALMGVFYTGIDFHADTCLPCPDGKYSTTNQTQLGCVPCPANTYTTIQTDQCTPCPFTEYSLPGATSCIERSICTTESYAPVYTACVNNRRNLTYVKLQPDTCIGGVTPPTPRTGLACAPCPPYTISQDGQCVSCPPETVFSQNECILNAPGNIVQYSKVYFGDDSVSYWPDNFITGCSGVCGSDGWRILLGEIDSGFHSTSTVDSWVELHSELTVNGKISFTYTQATITSGSLTGLTFSIDGQLQDIGLPSGTPSVAEFNVPAGPHKFVWNYHQEAGTGIAKVKNIALVGISGSEDGAGAGAVIPCPPGQFSEDSSATSCSLCPPGSYAPQPGSSTCLPCDVDTYNPYSGATACLACGYGSFATETGSTQCSTSCIFVLHGDLYDLRGLNRTVTTYDDYRQKFLINVCANVGDNCKNSHVCTVDVDGSVVEAGNSLSFVPDDDNSTTSPFSIHFENGELCPNNVAQSTVIQFECDTVAPTSAPTFSNYDDDTCTNTFTWRSRAACRACTDSDYIVIRGVCSGGHRKMSKNRVSPCNGELSYPMDDEDCSGREFPLAAILVVVFVFVAVVAVAAFIFFRNRRLSAQYAALVEETRSSNVTL